MSRGRYALYSCALLLAACSAPEPTATVPTTARDITPGSTGTPSRQLDPDNVDPVMTVFPWDALITVVLGIVAVLLLGVGAAQAARTSGRHRVVWIAATVGGLALLFAIALALRLV